MRPRSRAIQNSSLKIRRTANRNRAGGGIGGIEISRRDVERRIKPVKNNKGLNKPAAASRQTGEPLPKVPPLQKSLSARLLEAQEAERHRIARELHDEIGQSLTAIKIRLQLLQRRSKAGLQDIKECIRVADRVLSQVQGLSLDLRPPQLDDLGLPAALRWLLDRQAQAAKLIPHFSAGSFPGRLRPNLKIACFRVSQEALTNVIRHARARQVWVKLRRRGSELHLMIQDDGIGFDPSARNLSDPETGMGLIGMRERAELAGGRLTLTSSPARGTKVHLVFQSAFLTARTRSEKRGS